MKNTQTPTIYFDLDGTLYDLYGQVDWLPRLRAGDASAYASENATLVDMVALHEALYTLLDAGYSVGVVSWLAKDSTPEYDKAVRAVKRDWVKKFLPMATEIHIVKYGTPKHRVVANPLGIIVDDDSTVRESWRGLTIDANSDILESLRKVA